MRARHVLAVGAVLAALAGCSPEAPPKPPPDVAAAEAAAGIPPPPDRPAAEAYVTDLKNIDPDIVNDADLRKLVDRGRDQCGSVRQWPDDQAKLVDLTNRRFVSPNHPDGFGEAKAAKILEVVRKRICPTY